MSSGTGRSSPCSSRHWSCSCGDAGDNRVTRPGPRRCSPGSASAAARSASGHAPHRRRHGVQGARRPADLRAGRHGAHRALQLRTRAAARRRRDRHRALHGGCSGRAGHGRHHAARRHRAARVPPGCSLLGLALVVYGTSIWPVAVRSGPRPGVLTFWHADFPAPRRHPALRGHGSGFQCC
ncbi:hypothetical protein HBB16_01250 [Pseudonocardia sp. MCCB 268]|nr:hypothetical protein [Pseudonocardia cytotoxica]